MEAPVKAMLTSVTSRKHVRPRHFSKDGMTFTSRRVRRLPLRHRGRYRGHLAGRFVSPGPPVPHRIGGAGPWRSGAKGEPHGHRLTSRHGHPDRDRSASGILAMIRPTPPPACARQAAALYPFRPPRRLSQRRRRCQYLPLLATCSCYASVASRCVGCPDYCQFPCQEWLVRFEKAVLGT